MLSLLLWAAYADPAAPPAGPVEAPALPGSADPADHAVFVWQGFDHYWLRRVFGAFAVPHRVSQFESRIVDERHQLDGDAVRSTAAFQLGQSVGVDGDWMQPVGFWSLATAPDVTVHRGVARFEWEDQTEAGRAPKAFRRYQEMLIVPRPPEVHGAAILQGIALGSQCRDGADSCTSDGFWPYRFLTSVGACEPVGGHLACPLTVESGRAWTPQRGGLRGAEVKKVSERMAIHVDVSWAVLTGTDDALAAHRYVFENAVATDRLLDEGELTAQIPGVPGRYGAAVTGLSSFGFTLFPAARGKFQQHRGRYIGGWAIRLRDAAYDPATGVVQLGHSGGIFLPRTVARTGMSVELGFTTFQLGHPDARVTPGTPVVGELCKNSGEQTPAFSKWERCDDFAGGRERTSITVPFEAP